MTNSDRNTQRINLADLEHTSNPGRKASRIELRLLRDAYSLTRNEETKAESTYPDISLKRVTAYCTADSYDLKGLYRFFKQSKKSEKVLMFFGECLYVRCDECDIYFLDYGVVVSWGLEENQEQSLLNVTRTFEKTPYEYKSVETESFLYGVSDVSKIGNDKIYIKDDNFTTKMVLSTAIAQSVKLDYFEELVEYTIEMVKDLPEEVEKEGNIGRTRNELFKIMGKLHKLSFDLNLASNILDEPDLIWHFESYSPMYETCLRYLDIKSRTDLLNKRCTIIHGILDILNSNITTHNSETLEKRMSYILQVSAGLGGLQCILLGLMVYFLSKK
ncbi:RMD1 [Enterospora canceri]|uniref:RMD1 n=1 Tax=Enterospora canceri TaxID=1081671 RepID=A0A1Y1S866_9MICR|nr:RMD1 [Enterospora canceri]